MVQRARCEWQQQHAHGDTFEEDKRCGVRVRTFRKKCVLFILFVCFFTVLLFITFGLRACGWMNWGVTC